jgi:metallo-beta-lactamase family protein
MAKLTFYGGAQEVTGSCFLLETATTRILVDCGLFQCPKVCALRNYEDFSFDPKAIDALFISHAHIDHVGRIPRLVRQGFRGKIYSTPPTMELAELMMRDSMGLLEREVERETKKEAEPLYTEEDIGRAMELWHAVDYGTEVKVGDMVAVPRDAGHILGSTMWVFTIEGKKIAITGDLGNPETALMRQTYVMNDLDYLVMEAVYGDRIHESAPERKMKLERAIEDTIKAGGVLMIPAFSLERTQELLYELNGLVENGRVPAVPVFLDSPLAIKATEIYKKYHHYFSSEAERLIKKGDNIFQFPLLKMTASTEASKAINEVPPPKIIIAGSGMSTGGRIVHHEHRYLSNSKNTLLLVGYQAARSLGRQLQDGAKTVHILGDVVPVLANVLMLSGYSAHADHNALYSVVERSADTLKHVFVAQSEPKAALFLVQRIRDYLGIEASSPKIGESVEF